MCNGLALLFEVDQPGIIVKYFLTHCFPTNVTPTFDLRYIIV